MIGLKSFYLKPFVCSTKINNNVPTKGRNVNMCCLKFIRLRLNTLLLAAGMKGEVNRTEAQLSVGGLKLRRNCALIPRSWLRGASFDLNEKYFNSNKNKSLYRQHPLNG
ncbi:MAG: hypothetical protein P1P89_10160 [Desulfobacterales bacterium]|nr:hypothetical protein [Desulfobacterales bacterium]